MELIEFDSLKTDFDKLQTKIKSERPAVNIDGHKKQYDPKLHAITDTATRPDKIMSDGKTTKKVSVARLPVAMQPKIVRLAAAFLCGNPIELENNAQAGVEIDLLSVVVKTWEDNKLDYESKALAKLMMSETEVAEIWYPEPVDAIYWENTPNKGKTLRLRMKIVANSLGSTLHPIFNNLGDMIAFGRGYKLKEGDKEIECFDVYTETQILKGKKTSGWEVIAEANMFGKIPVIYYSQQNVEWYDVQELIDRMEVLLSNHADTNDYNGSPIIKVRGKVTGFSTKGEQGKVIQLEGEKSDASYMSWDNAPESIKLEYNNLRSLIFDLTDTPDISIEQMKSLGTYSGIALKMLFMGAHLKAADKEEYFGKSIQRRLNFLKAALAKINTGLEKGLLLSIKPVFKYYLPRNEKEIIDMLSIAAAGKPIISQATAVAQNPYVADPEAEMETIKSETTTSVLENDI